MEDKDNVKFVFISESCIPLKTFDIFYKNMMKDDLRTSYIKFSPIKTYDLKNRIEKQLNYELQGKFIKHYARMCLSRYHSAKLLEKDFTFFNKMHVGDEFFLTLIHPERNKDYIKDFEITYDNWDDIQKKVNKIANEARELYGSKTRNELSPNTRNIINMKKKIRDDLSKNPKTYTDITLQDLEIAINKESFFWRKFTREPLPWTSEILSISISDSIKPNLQTRKNVNKKFQKRKSQKNLT
jgi:hypothetical protein